MKREKRNEVTDGNEWIMMKKRTMEKRGNREEEECVKKY